MNLSPIPSRHCEERSDVAISSGLPLFARLAGSLAMTLVLLIGLSVYRLFGAPPARASCRVIEAGDECTSFGGVPTQYTLPADEPPIPNSACPNPAAEPGKTYDLCCLDDTSTEQQQYGRYFDSQGLANSTDALRAPICNSAVETLPSCATCFDGGQLNCYGYDFSAGKYDQSIKDYFDQGGSNDDLPPEIIDPDGDGKFMYNGQVYDAQAVYACRENNFACGTPGCTPNFKYEQPRGSSAAEIELDQAVAAGKLCYQVEIKDPHPLRPAPALACQKQVPEPWGLSCANDAVPIVTIGRPRTTTHPTNSDQGPKYETVCSFDGPYGRANCTRFELLTKNIIGEVDITIDLTGLELPIAGIASRNCAETGECDVDKKNADGELYLTDGFKMRNYTSWYLQGAIEQAEQEPLNYFDTGDTLKRVLAYAGPIKKLIPEESLDAEKGELIAMVEGGKSYNAIVGYIDAGQVISRRQAREKGLTDKSHVVRVKDMPKYNPGWDPHAEDGGIGYYLWRMMPFTGKDLAKDKLQNAGQVDVAGEIFPTACLKSQTNLEGCTSGPCRCQSDEKVLDAEFKVTSGLESFKIWYPHLVEDETLLASLLQKALVSSDIPQTGGYPTFSQLKNNLTEVNRKPEWTEADGHAWINADGCKRENALWNEGDSLEAKRNQTQGLIKGKLKFKREVDYSYQAETDASRDYINRCNAGGWGNCPAPLPDTVDVPAKSPIPVHIRYSHMNEIGDLTVFGQGSIFKALYPEIPLTIGKELIERPAESSIAYRCTAKNGSCKASSTSHKNQPMAFFPRWGSTLELFHQKIQAMLDPLSSRLKQIGVPAPLGFDSNSPYATNDIQSALSAAAAKNNVPLSLLQAIYEIEGTEYAAYGSCVQSSAGAVGPMQIVNSQGSAYWMVADEQERATLNLCNPGDAAEIAARILKLKVGGNVTLDKDTIKQAARGYYGKCKPDDVTENRWGEGIGYCDFVLYRVGLCSALASTCDGE